MTLQRVGLCAICLLVLGSGLVAQDFKSEVFGGYQFTHFTRFEPSRSPTHVNGNGWNAAFTEHINHWLGVKADFSGAYGNDNNSGQNNGSVHMLSYTVGPVVSASTQSRFTPFAEALFGGYHETSSTFPSSGGFAMLAGGGIDATVGGHLAVRAVQVDWMYLNNNSPRGQGLPAQNSKSNVRISTGIILRF